jgi:hypothetical protein
MGEELAVLWPLHIVLHEAVIDKGPEIGGKVPCQRKGRRLISHDPRHDLKLIGTVGIGIEPGREFHESDSKGPNIGSNVVDRAREVNSFWSHVPCTSRSSGLGF